MNSFIYPKKKSITQSKTKGNEGYSISQKYNTKLARTFVFFHLVLVSIFVFFLYSCNSKFSKRKTKNAEDTVEKTKFYSENDLCENLNPSVKKTIFLTFDDGPNKGTINVYKTLKVNSTPATFFVIGSHIFGSTKQTTDFRLIKNCSLFETANHSYYHGHNNYNQYYAQPDKVLEDFGLMNDSLGIQQKLIRTPGNNSWRTCTIHYDSNKRIATSVDKLSEHDYTVIGWDVEWKTGKNKTLSKKAIEMVHEINYYFDKNLTQTQNQVVILLHDQHFCKSENIQELEYFIDIINKDGKYIFKKLSEYPNL